MNGKSVIFNGAVLVTGGLGYIGAHIVVHLIRQGYRVVIVDNLVNSSAQVCDALHQIVHQKIAFYQLDIRDKDALIDVMKNEQITSVIHCAALKAVGESVQNPMLYYDNNIHGGIALLQSMQACAVKSLIFSSSATVYGAHQFLPMTENHPLNPNSPYGQTKLIFERMLIDMHNADAEFHCAILRYFNPVGADESALIGENPRGIPNNLMPYIIKVASKAQPFLRVWGNDYETPDGTGVRDYIHVVDLAQAHVLALEKLAEVPFFIVNLGTGRGYSVFEVIAEFERVTGIKIPYEIHPRRDGDVAKAYADVALAKQLLDWQARHSLAQMCLSHLRSFERMKAG